MGQTTDINAYADIRALMDRALETPKGIRVRCANPADAHRKRMNVYSVRHNDLKLSRQTWPEGHPNHNTTVYASLAVWRATEDGTKVSPSDMTQGEFLYIVPVSALEYDVEEL